MGNLELQIRQIQRDKYHSRWSPKILKDIARVKAGEPLDYIIGWTPFLGCRIDLSAQPLIPRPETEFWTEKFIERVRHKPFAISHKPFRILDAFAGSGCIGIAILKHLTHARVDFADIDPRVLRGIKITAQKNRIAPTRYSLIRSDVLKSVHGAYDAIVANPPYIGAAERMQPSVMKYEPQKALFGGRDGLRFIRALIKTAPQHLTANGALWMEYGPSKKNAIKKMLEAHSYRNVQFHKDQYGRWRYVTAQRPE
ncbi:MAG: peptide chain release factor N(5)-glutamine methyltransferase [Candidatus Harrisonbacteria bacterium]|nr:peptide chain release factor N(5)-glutamine methyltransferase [Candidatus Harrisonbacteria bacterium]MBI2604109.1 peptide chain release factor N(5)-glutamine methyltransferase [Candidatus Harrisonbacteria bacterium]